MTAPYDRRQRPSQERAVSDDDPPLPKVKAYKIGVKMPKPSQFDIDLARIYAETLGGIFLETFEKNMKTMEGK